MRTASRPRGVLIVAAVTLGLALTLVLQPLVLQPVAVGAGTPETRLVTYTWSHTAHLATFNFDSPGQPAASFECELDGPGPGGSGWAPCTSPRQYTSLAEGVYTFRVRAGSLSGGTDPTPAQRLFNIGVDTDPPETSFTTVVAPTTARSASFHFTSDESGTYECRHRRSGALVADWAECASPLTLDGLLDGQHQVDVRAIDPSGEYDRTPASHSWLVDATAPETSLSVGSVGAGAVSFSFAGGNTHQCRLDGPAQAHDWTVCRSPWKYAGLPDGAYTFAVRALDHHGNADPTPPTHGWVFDSTPRRFVMAERPVARGTVRVGKVLRASPGSWSPAPTARRYRWLRNGKRIGGATGPRYRIRRADRGDRISVRVTVRRDGYRAAAAQSRARRVR